MPKGDLTKCLHPSPTMNGCILPGTPIAVDHWKVGHGGGARVFFLSHMHADHTRGLTPSWNQKIYCSPVSKKLLMYKLQVHTYFKIYFPICFQMPLDENGDFFVNLYS